MEDKIEKLLGNSQDRKAENWEEKSQKPQPSSPPRDVVQKPSPKKTK